MFADQNNHVQATYWDDTTSGGTKRKVKRQQVNSFVGNIFDNSVDCRTTKKIIDHQRTKYIMI